MRHLLANPFRWLSPAGPSAKLTMFIFHRVLAQADPLMPDEPDADRFDRIVKFIADYFNVLPVAEAALRLGNGTLPAAAAAITFDDGYADNLAIAAPILKRYGLTATFFIATGYTGGGRMWNDTLFEALRSAPAGDLDWSGAGLGQYVIRDGDSSRKQLFELVRDQLKYRPLAERLAIAEVIAASSGLGRTSDLMMTREDLIELRNMGMDIGGHTVMHPILANLDEAAAEAEIFDGKRQLGEWLGEEPEVFAYPNGVPGKDYTERDVDLVRRAGYRAAVSTAHGCANAASDRFQLPRFTPWDKAMPRFALRCGLNLLGRAA